jgi:hypothetical protein
MWGGHEIPIWDKEEGISKQISGKTHKEYAWIWKEDSLQREKQVIRGG